MLISAWTKDSNSSSLSSTEDEEDSSVVSVGSDSDAKKGLLFSEVLPHFDVRCETPKVRDGATKALTQQDDPIRRANGN